MKKPKDTTPNRITGLDLIELGYKPDAWFKLALVGINSWEAKYRKDESVIRHFCDRLVVDKIDKLDEPVPYELFMEGSTKDELDNIEKVKVTMDEVMKLPVVVSGQVMPDGCPAGPIGTIPVGGVVGVHNAIVPDMHSADICCSLMMSFIRGTTKEVFEAANKATHFGYGSNKYMGGKVPLELRDKIENNPFTKPYLSSALKSIGTQGDGNHFLSVGTSKMFSSDPINSTVIVTHHGSRSFGAGVYKAGKIVADRMTKKIYSGFNGKNSWIPFDTQEGQDYWEALQIVREWTKLNHIVIHELIETISERYLMKIPTWNEHNFVFKDGDTFYHAKGATPLIKKFVPDNLPGVYIVPLNMGEPILIVEQGESGNLFAPHGAGRNYSRSEHVRRSRESVEDTLKREVGDLDIRFYSGTPDISELPSAYKNADEVKRQIEKFKLAKVFDEITPYGCIMAGKVEQNWKRKKSN